MNDTQAGDPPASDPTSKAELLERIHRSRMALEETLRPLSEAQLTRPGPHGGWAIKDHLVHLAVWERGIVEHLRGHPRFQAMGVEHVVTQAISYDEINEAIYRQHAGLSVPEVMAAFQSAHREMLKELDLLKDHDLFKPFASFVPGTNETRQEPVIGWIIGNTSSHFDEHRDYILALLREP